MQRLLHTDIAKLNKVELQAALKGGLDWVNELDSHYFWLYGVNRCRAKCDTVDNQIAEVKKHEQALLEKLRERGERIEQLEQELAAAKPKKQQAAGHRKL